jgi:hypothetical protein
MNSPRVAVKPSKLKGEWLEKSPAGQSKALGTQSKVGKMLRSAGRASTMQTFLESQPFFPSYNLLQATTWSQQMLDHFAGLIAFIVNAR